MYNPVKDGIKKSTQSVSYTEIPPPSHLSNLVHAYWELKTNSNLPDDFCLHVIPDACVNVLFNLIDTNVAAVTARETTYVVLNLGKSFHYVGIQFLPGMWQGNREEIVYGYVDTPYLGNLPLIDTAKKLAQKEFSKSDTIFSDLVTNLIDRKIVVNNEITSKILSDIDVIDNVSDMAASANLSPRQLQRKLKQTTGFSPHDFLKILRLQQAFRGHYLEHYVDQSHFIHSFRKITGYTPADYFKSFNV